MNPKQVQYELKLPDNDGWTKVSEKIFLNQLADNFYPITPIIIKLLRGREVAGPSVRYRINIQPGAKGILIPRDRSMAQTALN